MRHIYYVFFLALIISSCQSLPEINGFNQQVWQDDVNGCLDQRIFQVDTLVSQKNILAGLGQEQIIAILGNPDRHELYSRNKKAFVYYVNAGPDCPSPAQKLSKLIVRFDGIGRSKEIVYYSNKL